MSSKEARVLRQAIRLLKKAEKRIPQDKIKNLPKIRSLVAKIKVRVDELEEGMQKPYPCTQCGKRRIIHFVCTLGMDDSTHEPKPKKRELCKECSRLFKCSHDVCLTNWRERNE